MIPVRFGFFAAISIVVIALLSSLFTTTNVMAADARQFNAGNIIDDAVFTNNEAMSVAQIQNFLNSKVTCDTYGKKISELGGGTRAQWLAARGISTPITCLRDYYENPSTGANNYGKSIPAGAISAAQIIYNYSQQFGINPQTLIVTLQKENGLITDEWPTPKQYSEAMGFGCPDNVAPGAPACDPQYGSFSAQIYQAARHFRGYINNSPGWWIPFTTGNNSVRWSPAASCGSSAVNIQNRSTVALYSYTPYRPNQAALNAQYGTGDSCSAYGNRNFYLYFNDWFGSTMMNGNFVRTVSNATVYLVGNSVKYPIADVSILGAASALGGVGYVSQAYLDNIPTGSTMGRIIQSPDGTIYFFDSNIKLPFASCGMVTAYGSECGAAAKLTQAQVDKFANGPFASNGMKTTSGRLYYITEGTKREVLDNESLEAAGLPTGYNVLSDSAFGYLPYGVPYIRNEVMIQSRQDASKQVFGAGLNLYNIKRTQSTNKAFSAFPVRQLDDQSIQKLTISTQVITDSLIDESNNTYALTTDGKKLIPDLGSFGVTPVAVPSSVIGKMAGSGALTNPSLIKSYDNGTVYVVVAGQKRPLISMDDLQSITGESQPYIAWMSNDFVDAIPTGNIIVGAGRLVKTPSNATVYMTDGYDKLVPMSSFDPSKDLGIKDGIRTIGDAILSKYAVDPIVLTSYVSCNGTNYMAMGGVLYQMSIEGQIARVLQSQTCNVLTKKTALPRFVRSPDGTIYELKDGKAHPIASMTTFTNLSASGGVLVTISQSGILLLPKGSMIL